MNRFSIILAAMFAALLTYTLIAVSRGGLGFIPIFLTSLASLTWGGQFNLGFLFALWIGALWIAWRSGFSVGGILLAIVGHPGGMLFFCAYLLWLMRRHDGDMRGVLFGVHDR